jgi:hypothetical protein
MKIWTGKVTKKFHRDFQGTKLYSFQLEGTDRWFRTGKEMLPFDEGQMISFTEKNSQVVLESVEETDSTVSASATVETEAAVTSETTLATSPSTSTTSSTAPTVGERMAWENARRDATRIIATALEVEGKGMEVLPWAKNVAKGKRLDLLIGYVHQVTRQLMEESHDAN